MKTIFNSFIATIFYTLILGFIYPSAITFIGQSIFKYQSNGSLVTKNKDAVGSKFIGQNFTSAKYFFGRPSSTSTRPYNAESSSGSNLALSNQKFVDNIKNLTQSYSDQYNANLIPVDLITSSGSGLDPEISVASAYFQISRISKERNILEDKLYKLVDSKSSKKIFGLFGTNRVNVLDLNIGLDDL